MTALAAAVDAMPSLGGASPPRETTYAAPRSLLVVAKNGVIVRRGVGPDSDEVARLARFDAVVAVGEAVHDGKLRLRLAAPPGWATANLFVERRDAVARDDWAGTRLRAEARGAFALVATDPLAFTLDGFATPAECDRIMKEAEPYLAAALAGRPRRNLERRRRDRL